MKRFVISLILIFALSLPAYACGGGGLTGGALESTQQINRTLLSAIEDTGITTANNTVLQYAKQLQQYANEVQQLAEAVKNTVSMPFSLYNDLKNSATGIYNTLKGTGEGLFSYANADNWYNDMKNRSGALAQAEYNAKSSKATRKVLDDIITKEESEAYLEREAENMSRAATGTTSAVQANTVAEIATTQAVKNLTAAVVTYEQRMNEHLMQGEYYDKEAEQQAIDAAERNKTRMSSENGK